MLDVDQRPAVRDPEVRDEEAFADAALAPDARLDRPIEIGRIRGEALAWVGVLLLATGLRLASLQSAALSPDGARRAFAAYALFTGGGMALDSVAGGPFATLFGAILFFLFGVSDVIARLGPALAGIGAVAATLWLRPYLGRAGALLAGFLLAISPAAVYFSRLVAPDAYAVFFAVLLFVALLRVFDHGRRGDLILAAAAGAFLIVSAPTGPTLLLILGTVVALVLARGRMTGAVMERNSARVAEDTPFGAGPLTAAMRAGAIPAALVVLTILALVFTAFGAVPGNLVSGPGDLLRAWGRSLLGPPGSIPGRGPGFALGLLPLYEPLVLLAGVAGIARLLLRQGASVERGGAFARAALAVWAIVGVVLLALGGARQPGLLLLPVIPLTLLAGATIGELIEAVDWRFDGAFGRAGAGLALCAMLALAAWGATLGILLRPTPPGVTASGRFLDLLLTAIVFAVPLTLGAYWFARQADGATAGRTLALVGFLLLVIYGFRSAVGLGIYRADATNEPLVYDASTPEVLPLMNRILRLSRDATAMQRTAADPTGGHGIPVLLDPAVEWPAHWYLRDFPDLRVAPAATAENGAARGVAAPGLIFRPADGASAPAGFTDRPYKLRWSYLAGQPLVGGEDNGVLRFLAFALFRDNVPPAPSDDVIVGYGPDLAQRLFPPPPAQGPFGLGERAGVGKAPGQFDSPRGVAIGRDGSVYVVDMRNARVQQFSRDGAFVRQFGAKGHGDGQLWSEAGRGPTGIAVDADGFVYVADTWNYRIQKYSPEGQFVAKWGTYTNLVTGPANGDRTGLYGPRGIAFGPGGDLYVTDTGNGRVVVYDRNGTFRREFGTKGPGPNQLDEPVGIAVSPDGARVYVADSNNARIAVFDGAGRPIVQWAVPAWQGRQYYEPYLALDANGALYATSSATKQVLKFNANGQIVSSSAGGTAPEDTFSAPYGIAVTPDRGLYVTDGAKHFVTRINALP